MKKLIGFIGRMFLGIKTSYLIKSYFFAIILGYLGFIGPAADSGSVGLYIYIAISTVLYPFATVLWDDLVGTLMGNVVITLPLVIMLFWKTIKIFFLFLFTPLIAPIGIIYIYIANGFYKTN